MVGNRLGRRTLQAETTATTDADGRYQMLSGLGELYIRVEPPASAMTQGDAATFAPSTGDPGKATPVLVANGSEADNIDVVIGKTFRVAGRVVNMEPGATIPSLVFVSNSKVDFALTLPNTSPGSDGEFSVVGVPEGSWNVFAPASNPPGKVGRASVDIAGKDVLGVLAPAAALEIAGKLIVQGTGDAGNPSVNLVSREHIPSTIGQVSHTRVPLPDGSFRFENVLPLQYGVQVSGLRLGWYVSDIRVAGASVFEDAVVSRNSQAVNDLEIVVAQGTGKLEGTVVLPPNTRLNDARVVLVPDEPRRANPLLYRTASIRSDGSFTMLPEPAPGNYKVFAVTFLPAGGAEMDPVFLERHMQSAIAVTIVSNQTAFIEIK
jgi:hypothetical protein